MHKYKFIFYKSILDIPYENPLFALSGVIRSKWAGFDRFFQTPYRSIWSIV